MYSLYASSFDPRFALGLGFGTPDARAYLRTVFLDTPSSLGWIAPLPSTRTALSLSLLLTFGLHLPSDVPTKMRLAWGWVNSKLALSVDGQRFRPL